MNKKNIKCKFYRKIEVNKVKNEGSDSPNGI